MKLDFPFQILRARSCGRGALEVPGGGRGSRREGDRTSRAGQVTESAHIHIRKCFQ